jgi:hypothetical protein
VVSTVGFVFGSELAERTLIKHGRAIATEGGEMGEDVYTAQLLVGGDMQAAYNATRGPYGKYQAAFTAFSDASTQFLKDQARDGVDGYLARAKDIAAMEAAEKEMRDTSGEYQIACAKLGVQTNAKRLDTLGAHIMQGHQEVVATAVTVGLPEVAPGLGELRQAFKGAEGMSAKQIEKEAAEAVAQTIVKQEGKALTVGLEAEARTGMPVKNQQAIADACKTHDVVVDVRPTNPQAPRRLAEGNLPKPEAIKAKSINELDTFIGFRKEDVGLVGYMEPKPPVQSQVPPELWEQVQKRYAERLSEFKDLAPEMKNLARPVGARDQFAAVGFDKQVTVDANGVIRVVDAPRARRPPASPATIHLPDHEPRRLAGVAAEVQRGGLRARPAAGRSRARGPHALGCPREAGESGLQGPDQGLPGDRGEAHAQRQGRRRPVPVRPRRIDHAGPREPGHGHARRRPHSRARRQGSRGARHREDGPGDRPAVAPSGAQRPVAPASIAGVRECHVRARSSCPATCRSRSSRSVWAVSITPSGRPSRVSASGRLTAGWPVRLAIGVKGVFAKTSSVQSSAAAIRASSWSGVPEASAGVGAVGQTKRS